MTELKTVKATLEERCQQLLLLADDPDSPMDPVDRTHIQLYLGERAVPVSPADWGGLLKRYASSCLSYSVIRKKLTSLLGAIPSEETIGTALDLLYGTKAFSEPTTWTPEGLLTAVESIQAQAGWSEADLTSRTPEKRILAVLKDGARYFLRVCPHGDLQPFYAQVRMAVSKGAAAMWDFAEELGGAIRMVGPALASDFLKNIGFSDYVKIDHHFGNEFPALIDQAPRAPKGLFIHSLRLAEALGVTPFFLDHLLYQWGRYQRHINPGAKPSETDYQPPFSFDELLNDVKIHLLNDLVMLVWTYGLEGTASVFEVVSGMRFSALFADYEWTPDSYLATVYTLEGMSRDPIDISGLPIAHTFRHLYEYAYEQRWDMHNDPDSSLVLLDDVQRHLPFARQFVDRADYFEQVDFAIPTPQGLCALTIETARVRLRYEQGERAFTFKELSALINRQEKTLRNLAQSGTLKSFREGGAVLIDIAGSRYLMDYANSGKPHPQLRKTVSYNTLLEETQEAIRWLTEDCESKGEAVQCLLDEFGFGKADERPSYYRLANELKQRGLLQRMSRGSHFFYTAHLRYGQA